MTATARTLRALVAALLVVAALGGCELMKKNEEATTVINRRAIGMSAGEFFDRFGRPGRKRELADGSSEYDWVSSVPFTRPGPEGQDERICRLKIGVDGKGRIGAVQVLYDAQGQHSTSRCGEIFGAP